MNSPTVTDTRSYVPPPLPSLDPGWGGWRWEGLNAVVAACAAVFLGAAVGLVVGHLAPHLNLVRNSELFSNQVFQSETAISADASVLIAGVVAGIVVGALAGLIGRRPPVGRLLGLCAGSIGGSIVSALVATAVRTQAFPPLITATFNRNGIGYLNGVYQQVAGAKPVLLAWPLAAVIAYAAVVAIRGDVAPRAAAAVRLSSGTPPSG